MRFKCRKVESIFSRRASSEEITELQKQIKLKEKESDMYNQKRKEFSEKLQSARDAEATLKAHSISSKEDLIKIQNDTESKRQKIP